MNEGELREAGKNKFLPEIFLKFFLENIFKNARFFVPG